MTKLTDAQLAAIAWTDEADSHVALAARIGANAAIVAHHRKRIRALGGWGCPLLIVTCAECARPLITSAASNRRTVHRACDRARMRRKSAERRAAGTAPLSTPYVAAWRQAHPDATAQQRISDRVQRRQRERARRAAGQPVRDDEARLAALMERERAEQERSRERAHSHQMPWTRDEDNVLRETTHLPIATVAAQLGRTVYAVKTRRRWLRQRGELPPPHRAGDATPPERIPQYGKRG